MLHSRLVAGILLGAATLAPAAEPLPATIEFNRDIRPILSNNCLTCHGPDAAERQGGTDDGLRLDDPADAVADLGGYAAVVPGKPGESELVARITATDETMLMPPHDSGKRLSPREIELLTKWIEQGADYARHWSYVRPVRPELPKIERTDWPRNEIDRFILARLEREGLAPSDEADRHALIRRVALDLTGLPPTWAEVERFVNDADPRAYENLVDRLLAKESYGEHWARSWLDLARYADSAGYADDPPRTIWPFRDYVIRSLNANKPLDQFTIEQMAGDLLPDPTDEQLIATAFHRNTLTNNEGGTNDEEFRNVAIVDRVNTTMAVWMGTTMACAQCHSHKYDPVTQEEYFQFFAFFNDTEDADRRDESPLLSRYSAEQLQRRTALETEESELETKLNKVTPEFLAEQARWDEHFPRQLAWQSPKPASVVSREGTSASIADDAVVSFATAAAKDTYTIELPIAAAGKLHALRLEALTDDALPGKGPGHGGGNFVLSRVSATVTPPADVPMSGRYVRVEQKGQGVVLHLAEVQVFRDDANLATSGEAKQISTAFEGPANLAIDGNTNGDYDAKSVSHTAQGNDPWWEVDLKSEQPLDRIVLWNRTDHGLHSRLNDFRVVVLNDKRETIWERSSTDPPKTSREFSLQGAREVAFASAIADYEQPGFAAHYAITPEKDKGWAVGGQTGQPHSLTLVASSPIELAAGSKLTVTLEQQSPHEKHTLGRFRLSWTDDARAAELAQTPASVAAILNTPAEQRTEAQKAELTKHYLTVAPSRREGRKRLQAIKKQLADMKPEMTVPIMRELAADQRRVTKLQHRGNFLDVGQTVTAGTPAAFPPLPDDAPKDRLALARWLVSDENPLTARVLANRFWEQIFGIGLVATSEDFGSQGEQPSHPELLDWLATELVRLDWDQKAFLKMLVTSAAYRQSSRVTPELATRDPDNRLLARGPRVRLSAEMVRDQALAVSGLLSDKMYGPPVNPPQPSIGLNAAFGGKIDWQDSKGADKYRRGLYTTWRRSNPYPSMATFDAPNREVCTVRRDRTNTPLQALVTLNDPVYVEAAQALARRIVAEGGDSASDRVRSAFRICLSRQPSEAEEQRLIKFYDTALAEYRADGEAAMKMATDPLGAAPADADVAELAAWSVVGNVLLNLDEMLMKR